MPLIIHIDFLACTTTV